MHSVDKKIQNTNTKECGIIFRCIQLTTCLIFSALMLLEAKLKMQKKAEKLIFLFVCTKVFLFWISIPILGFPSLHALLPTLVVTRLATRSLQTFAEKKHWKTQNNTSLKNTEIGLTSQKYRNIDYRNIEKHVCFSFLYWPQDQYHSPFILEQEDRSLVWIRLAVVMLWESRNRASTIDNCIWTTIHESPLTIDNCI